MDDAVGGNDAVALREVVRALVVGAAATGFADDEGTSHVVPLPDVLLGIGIETACSDIAEGDGGRTEHADTGHTAIELTDETLGHRAVGIAVVRQLETDEGIGKGRRVDRQRLAVEMAATAKPCIETLVGTDLVDHAQHDARALHQGDADGIGREVVNEIGGAVEGIDNPAVLLIGIGGRAFLGDETGLGQQLAQGADDELLRLFVDIRHVVVGMLTLDALGMELLSLLPNERPCPLCDVANRQGQCLEFLLCHGLVSIIFEYTAQIWVLAVVFLVAGIVADDGLVVVLAHGALTEYEVVEVDGGDDDAEEADAATLALDVETVVDVHGGEQSVVVVLHMVVLVELLLYLHLPGSGDGVGRGEDEAGVDDGLVNPVAMAEAVALLNPLAYVVVHLLAHGLLRGIGYRRNGSDDGQYADGEDESPQTTVTELAE